MTLAIIAGNGDLPKLIIAECERRKSDFIVILIEGEPSNVHYKSYNHYIVSIGSLGKLLTIFKQNKVQQIVFVGGIQKPSFSNLKVDKKGAVLLSKLISNKIFGDNNILTTITNYFSKEGFKIVGANDIVQDIIAEKGVLTKTKPSKSDLADIKMGENAIKLMSELDIGQAVVVQNKQIIGVEAIEGTDELIKRCGKIRFEKVSKPILIKIKKQNQNTKIDLPTIGVKTINNLIAANFAGIAIKSGSTLIIDKEKIIDLANKNKLFIIAI